MTDFALHAVPASRTLWRPSAAHRLLGAARYGVVLAAWTLFLLVRPAEALRILRDLRPDSPLRRVGLVR